MSFPRSNGRAVLIVLYPRVSHAHAVYFDPSRDYEKKDYTHIMNILDDALQGFSIRGGHLQIRKQRNKKTVSRIKLTSAASMSQTKQERWILHTPSHD